MPSEMILEGLYKSKLQNSAQFQTVLASNDQDSKQRKAELITITDVCKTSYWSDDENSKLQGSERCCGTRTSHQESKGKEAYAENPSCKVWHPPVCQNYKSEKGCILGDKCHCRHVEAEGKAQQKVKERWCERISCIIEGVYTSGFCILRFLSDNVYFHVNKGDGDRSTPSNSPRHLAPNQNSWKKGSIARNNPKCAPQERCRCAPKFVERYHMRRLCTKKDAPAEQHGIWRKYLQAQEFGHAGTYFNKTRGARIRCRFRSISAHVEQKKLSSKEMDTVKRSRTHNVLMTANEEVRTHEEAQVFVHDLNLFVTVLPLGKLCENHGYSCELVSSQKPHLIKSGIRIQCNTENFVPVDQRWEEYFLQTDNFVPLVVRQFWKRFVFHIAITGLVEKRGGNSSWKQHATCFKFIFRLTIRAKWGHGSRKLVRSPKKLSQK